jgi:hypothetical protein
LLDGRLLTHENQSLLEHQINKALAAQKNIVVVSEEWNDEELEKKLTELAFSPNKVNRLGRVDLVQGGVIQEAGGVQKISTIELKKLISSRFMPTDKNPGETPLQIKILVSENRKTLYAGDLSILLAFDTDVVLEGSAAQEFVDHLRTLYSPSDVERLVRDLSPDGRGQTLRLPARTPLLSEINQALQKDLLIRVQA